MVLTKEKYPEGKGKAKWLGYQKAKNDIVIYTDSDTKLIGASWIKHMVKPLIEDESISLSICRMAILKQDKPINRYLSYIGTDPFLISRSLDPLLALNKLKLIDKGDYFIYKITTDNFINIGSYCLAAKKKALDKIGGYTHDVEVSYLLAKNNLGKIAISKNATIHHLISDSIIRFTKKKYWWANVYFETQRFNREFTWMPNTLNQKIKLILIFVKNFSFILAAFVGVRMSIKYRELAWLLHPVMVWLTSASYLLSYIKNDILKKTRKSDIRTHQVSLS